MKYLMLFSLAMIAPLSALEPAKHTCRILFLDGPDSAPESLHLFDGAKAQEVELPRMNLSPVYELRAGDLSLAMLPKPPLKPDELPAGAPTAKVPAGLVDFYLLVVSDPANQVAPVRLQVMPAGAGNLRRGQMLWYNLTDNPVAGMIGSQKLAIKPMARETLDEPARGHVNYPVTLSFGIPGKEHVYPLCSTQWLHDPRSRHLAFIISKPGVRTPQVLVFPDYREEKEEP